MNTNPLAALRPRLEPLIDAVLADWDDPTMTGARICARHEITPEQLHAIAALPRFRETVAHLDAIRALRRPHVESRARADLFRSLTAIIQQDPTTASKAKEIRLAIKQLLTLVDGAGGSLPPDRAQPDAPKPPATPTRIRTAPTPSPIQPPRTRPNKPTPAATLLAGLGAAPPAR
ncbi:MAG: hypothetical protein LAT64_03230 [Phycisphaerales bacterium]|nr:hypothetical protein [Planctomycetota bacterium]MCH8507768.1 hypothetical protein [Phycisphaerales bacterium]